MSKLPATDNLSEMISARRTESLDAPNITKLVTPSTEFLFGRVNVINLIEKALLAVTLSNEGEDILGHAAFLDYPNVANVEPSAWVDWLLSTYEVSQCNSLNTLFMHYFVAKLNYSQGCAREIIRTMFNTIPNIHFCLLLVPTGVHPDAALGEIFHEVPRRRLLKDGDGHRLFICHRHHHVPVLHIREARVEDHDDLMPIFTRQTDVLTNTYGEYFLAELIEAQDDNMKCIVSEVDGVAVGFMSLCKDINIDILNNCFELAPFHGLRKPHPDDVVKRSFPDSASPLPVMPDKTPSPSAAASPRPDSALSAAEEDLEKKEKQDEEKKPEETEQELHAVTRTSSRNSITGNEEPVVKRRLSESPTAGVVDLSDVKSAEEEANRRSPNGNLQVAPEKPMRFQKPESPRPLQKTTFVPKYFGETNAFSIQLFCIDEKYEMRSCDFLPKAFELFSEQRYCIITLPHLVPEFPLLQHFMHAAPVRKTFPLDEVESGTAPELHLPRVTPQATSTLSQELYIFNALGLLNNITVRSANKHDFAGIQNLVESLELSESLLTDVKQYNKAHRDEDGTEIQVFVALVGHQVVGVAVLRREEDIEYIRSHYNIEDFIYFNHHRREEHAHLHHYALNPIFKLYSKHFLKEILRLGNKTSLYYPLYPAYVDAKYLERHSLVAALSDMVPVRARRQIDYPADVLGENMPSERVLKEQEQYALNHVNRKLVLEPKVTINARVVVVGASDVGIAFLETFSFCPHLRFNNLTLISPHGLPGEMPPSELRDQMRATSHCYSQKDYAQMGLRTWVNVVYGKMTAIDRNKKQVKVNGNSIVSYDHLILCTGTQYFLPHPTEADVDEGATNKDLPKKPKRRFEGNMPRNAFVINDGYDAAVALYWAERNLLETKNTVVVYGRSLDVCSCIQTLLAIGIEGEQIVLVETPLNSEVTCFNNEQVEKAVLEGLTEAGVRVYSGCILAQWDYYSDKEDVTSLVFTTDGDPVRLECSAFFSYYDKMVDQDSFRAINCACLVFDGRLVIDANFHTNDPAIRAAGPLTKYKRIYHADRWTHANFNSKEIGIQLASSMLSLFDPTIESEEPQTEDQMKLIPNYRSPKIQGAVLPGGYTYLHVEKPKLPSPLCIQMNKDDYGRELVTRKPGQKSEYFRLHINQYNAVETITCLSRSPYSSRNLLCLYGLHQRYLNNLLSRFDEGLITDFYSYFSESWAMAIFHDRFLDFRDEIRELLTTRSANESESLEELIRNMMDEDLTLTEGQKKMLRDRYVSSGSKQTVETRLLSFLTYNYYHLPMYAKPGMV